MEKQIQIEITRVSSKGQLVLPKVLRKKLKINKGTFLAATSEDNLIILKKADKILTEADMRNINEIEEAWKEIESGKARHAKKSEFLKELAKW